MHIETLSIENFRNYEHLNIPFGDAAKHILIGRNGAGKTNIIESLAMLSFSKSPLCKDDEIQVRWGEEYYRITSAVKSDGGDPSELSVAFQVAPRRRKACTVNGVSKKAAEYIGSLPLILFLPQDLDLFTGSPSRRRAFLDTLLCQVSVEYLRAYTQYQQILKQRNRLLKRIREGAAERSDLSPWNQALSEQGAVLTIERLALIEIYQCTLEEELSSRGESWVEPRMRYERKTQATDAYELQQELEDRLNESSERDVLLQATSVGPHREDWVLEVEGRPLSTFASRGQQRTALLCLLDLQISYLELKRGEKPVVLLDDVFSELDAHHQELLIGSISDAQVFLSTTHLPDVLSSDVCVWEVGDGAVSLQGASVSA